MSETLIARRRRLLNQAREIMDSHGLKSWKLVMDNAKRRLGCCNYRKNTIAMSKRHLEISQESEIIDTVLHEVAHALVGPNHGHDRIWMSMCVKIGAKLKRCKSVNEDFHEDAPFVAECNMCKKKWQRYRKPPANSFYRCPTCRCFISFVRQ